jgi:hypothetical protein
MPFVAGLLLFAVAQARDTVPSYVHDAAPEVRAGRASGDVKIDGRLDEPVWAAATSVTTFTQLDLQPGQPATERTEVRVLIGSTGPSRRASRSSCSCSRSLRRPGSVI